MKNILMVLGTAREGRRSEQVFNYVKNIVDGRGDVTITTADVREYEQSRTEGLPADKLTKWRQLVTSADGLIIVSPEYNHGYPGELKMLLDNAYKEYNGKPIGFCGVSDGPLGGARAMEQLKLVVSAFQANPINAAVYFANVKELFDQDGNIVSDEYYHKRVNGMVDEVIKYCR